MSSSYRDRNGSGQPHCLRSRIISKVSNTLLDRPTSGIQNLGRHATRRGSPRLPNRHHFKTGRKRVAADGNTTIFNAHQPPRVSVRFAISTSAFRLVPRCSRIPCSSPFDLQRLVRQRKTQTGSMQPHTIVRDRKIGPRNGRWHPAANVRTGARHIQP